MATIVQPDEQVQAGKETGRARPLTLMKAMIGECLCGPIDPVGGFKGMGSTAQFVELHGIQFIGLGAVMDELTAKERVYDTLQQLSGRTERLITIGYLADDDKDPTKKVTECIPLDIWSAMYPNDRTMSRNVKRVITDIKASKFEAALKDFKRDYQAEKRRPLHNNNQYLIGITAHNMGVVSVLGGMDHLAIPLFEEAVGLKRSSFGADHPEVAVSLDELGIQLFAVERYEEALASFEESRRILGKWYGMSHPRICMILNNIACCTYQMGKPEEASQTMNEARDLQRAKNENSAAKGDLDLLHLAIVLNNFGYVKAQVNHYEEARTYFEEALLIQQSVLGDAHNHRAIRDSRNNLDFVNAFHSE